jgi:hypothetical protein
MVISSLVEGEEIDDANWWKNLLDGILQNVLKECQLSVCRCFPSDSSPIRRFSKLIGSNPALSEKSGWIAFVAFFFAVAALIGHQAYLLFLRFAICFTNTDILERGAQRALARKLLGHDTFVPLISSIPWMSLSRCLY